MDPATYVNELRAQTSATDDARFASKQLLMLHEAALARPGGTFLELGTDRGQATKAILAACEATGGKLVSVDIRDCSSAASSPAWTFVQADSADWKTIVEKAPILKDGIDFVYVDSLHTAEHVTNEVYGWYPFVKDGGSLYFDDVDSGPYLAGERKDSAKMEIDNRQIRTVLEAIFYSNREVMDLSLIYGSTGLGVMGKHAPVGTQLAPLKQFKLRNSMLMAKIGKKLGMGGGYKHKRDGSDFVLRHD